MLTPEKKQKSLRSVKVINDKQCGKIKGKTCAGFSTQRRNIPKEDTLLPTISLEVLMTNFLVGTYEVWDVAIFYVPGHYLNADMPDDIYFRLKLEGGFLYIMCNVNPYHIPNIWHKNVNKVFYLRVLKALYRCIELDFFGVTFMQIF